jgi:uncharacterized membrane protein
MHPMLYTTLLLLHLLAAMVWIGGMSFVHFALRPAAEATLQPPQRVPLMVAALQRFFRMAAASVVLVLTSGFGMYFLAGAQAAPLGWHVMAVIGVVMAGVFAFIFWRLFPLAEAASAQAAWPDAAAVLKRIRALVSFNLALGVIAVAAAAFARV